MTDRADLPAGHEPTDTDHKFIWLSPRCEDERTWCQDDQGGCDECGEPSVKYIRADIAAARIEVLEAALRDIIKADDDFRASLSPKADRDPLTVIVDRVRPLLAQADYTQRINSALAAPVRDETEQRDKKELLAEALQVVKALNDWTHVNEAEWTGWGDGDVPPAAEWWRVKSGQALKALQEIRFSQTSKPEGDEASINIDRLKRGDFTPDSFDEHDNDDPRDAP